MILVTGATGTIGRALVRDLKARELPFRAFVRSEAKAATLDCDCALGDFDAPETLANALRGIDAVFLNGPAGEQMARQQRSVIEAARSAGVARIVKVSSRGADVSSELSMARGHGEAERALASSGLAFCVLRPSTFMQNLLRSAGSIRSAGSLFGAYGSGRIAFIDCEDIAACAAAALLDARHDGHTYTLTGPEALSYHDVAERCAAALGKPVRYVDLPPAQMREQLQANGLPAPFAETMVKLMIQFATGAAAATTSSVTDLLGRPARSLAQFLADNASAFR